MATSVLTWCGNSWLKNNKQIHSNQCNLIANNADQVRIIGERIIDLSLMFQNIEVVNGTLSLIYKGF